MIAEAAEVSLFSRVDKFALGERHEIEMLDPIFVIFDHALAEGLLGDDLANILEDEIIWLEVGIGAKAITFLLRLDDRDVGVELLLEALILAASSTPAISGAFHLGGTIDTIRIFTTGMVNLCLGVYTGC